jgi:hypothetical protein
MCVCYSCNNTFIGNIFKAFDQNFCSVLCRDVYVNNNIYSYNFEHVSKKSLPYVKPHGYNFANIISGNMNNIAERKHIDYIDNYSNMNPKIDIYAIQLYRTINIHNVNIHNVNKYNDINFDIIVLKKLTDYLDNIQNNIKSKCRKLNQFFTII